jgi:hypothetical protein
MNESRPEGLGDEDLRKNITDLLAHVWQANDPEGKTIGFMLDAVRTWLLATLRPVLASVPSNGMPVDFVAARLGQVRHIYRDAVRYWPPANMPRSYCHGGQEPELMLIDSMPVEALADLFKFLRIRPAREGDDG